MSATDDLITRIKRIVAANGRKEITGPRLQSVLVDMVNVLGDSFDEAELSAYLSAHAYATESWVAGQLAGLHTHTNLSVLNGIDSTKIAFWDGGGETAHTHPNRAALDMLSRDENGRLVLSGDLIVSGGVVAFADVGQDVSGIFDNLPLASDTAKGVASFSSAYFTVTDGVVTLRSDLEFGLSQSELSAYLSTHGYATQSWVTGQLGSLHTHSRLSVLEGITAEKVALWDAGGTGAHSHPNRDALDLFELDENGNVRLSGNLLVSGGVVALADGTQTGEGGGSGVDLPLNVTDPAAGDFLRYDGTHWKNVAMTSFAPASHTHPWGDITGKPSLFPPSSHTHGWGEVADKPTAFPPSSHDHQRVQGLYTGNGGRQPPSYAFSGFTRFNMMKAFIETNTGYYTDDIIMDNYSGSDVPYVTRIGVQKTASPQLYISSGPKGNTDLSSWVTKRVALTDDLAGYLPLTGGALSGRIVVSGESHFTDPSYGAADPLPSTFCALKAFGKLAATEVYSAGHPVWHSGNSNLSTVDWAARNLSLSGLITLDCRNLWGGVLQLGRLGGEIVAGTAIVGSTDGGLHLDGGEGKPVYLQYYHGGAGTALYVGADGNTGIGTVAPRYKLDVAGDMIADGWLRTTGERGWFNNTYGGGWHMLDAEWIRAYGGKKVYVSNTGADAICTSGGVKAYAGFTSIGSEATTTSISGGIGNAVFSCVSRYRVQWYDDTWDWEYFRGGSRDIAGIYLKKNGVTVLEIQPDATVKIHGNLLVTGGVTAYA